MNHILLGSTDYFFPLLIFIVYEAQSYNFFENSMEVLKEL